MQRLDIAGHHQRDPPFDSLGAKPAVDQVLALAADHDGDMPRRQERIAPLQLGGRGMAAPHRERVAVGIEALAVKAAEGVADRDHEVDGAGELRGEDRRSPPRHHVDGHVRRGLRDLLHQRRHQAVRPRDPASSAGNAARCWRRRNRPIRTARGSGRAPAPAARARLAPAASVPCARPIVPAGDRRSGRAAAAAHGWSAGCDSPIRIAARLTLASLSSASSATSRLRSSEFKFMEMNIYHTHYRLEECRGGADDWQQPIHGESRHEHRSQQETRATGLSRIPPIAAAPRSPTTSPTMRSGSSPASIPGRMNSGGARRS